jgi:hypothetical protein
MAKKIKSFTVDVDIYNGLMEKFKENKVEVSVSLYLNNCLKNLLGYLEFIEKKLSQHGYTVPMDFVIKEMVEFPHIGIPGEGREPEDAKLILRMELDKWENDYEADQKDIPRDMYPWVKGNRPFVLSADKRYIIDPKTGTRYIPIDGRLDVIEPIKE